MKNFNRAWSFCIGVLAAFLFDYPLTIKVFIALALAVSAMVLGDLVDALLSLWQAIAVAGLFFVLVDYATDMALNQTICALSIPVTWVCILAFKRKFLVVRDSVFQNRLQAEVVGFTSIALLFLVVPRGQLQNLSFLGRG